MKQFFNDAELAELFENSVPGKQEDDHRPVSKLFLPDEPVSWLLNKINPNNPNIVFGMTDFGDGEPPLLGWINLEQLSDFEGRYGFEVTKDKGFTADQPLSFYFKQAQQKAEMLRKQKEQSVTFHDLKDYPEGFNPELYDL